MTETASTRSRAARDSSPIGQPHQATRPNALALSTLAARAVTRHLGSRRVGASYNNLQANVSQPTRQDVIDMPTRALHRRWRASLRHSSSSDSSENSFSIKGDSDVEPQYTPETSLSTLSDASLPNGPSHLKPEPDTTHKIAIVGTDTHNNATQPGVSIQQSPFSPLATPFTPANFGSPAIQNLPPCCDSGRAQQSRSEPGSPQQRNSDMMPHFVSEEWGGATYYSPVPAQGEDSFDSGNQPLQPSPYPEANYAYPPTTDIEEQIGLRGHLPRDVPFPQLQWLLGLRQGQNWTESLLPDTFRDDNHTRFPRLNKIFASLDLERHVETKETTEVGLSIFDPSKVFGPPGPQGQYWWRETLNFHATSQKYENYRGTDAWGKGKVQPEAFAFGESLVLPDEGIINWLMEMLRIATKDQPQKDIVLICWDKRLEVEQLAKVGLTEEVLRSMGIEIWDLQQHPDVMAHFGYTQRKFAELLDHLSIPHIAANGDDLLHNGGNDGVLGLHVFIALLCLDDRERHQFRNPAGARPMWTVAPAWNEEILAHNIQSYKSRRADEAMARSLALRTKMDTEIEKQKQAVRRVAHNGFVTSLPLFGQSGWRDGVSAPFTAQEIAIEIARRVAPLVKEATEPRLWSATKDYLEGALFSWAMQLEVCPHGYGPAPAETILELLRTGTYLVWRGDGSVVRKIL